MKQRRKNIASLQYNSRFIRGLSGGFNYHSIGSEFILSFAVHAIQGMQGTESDIEVSACEYAEEWDAAFTEIADQTDNDTKYHVSAKSNFDQRQRNSLEGEYTGGLKLGRAFLTSVTVLLGADKFTWLAADMSPDRFKPCFAIVDTDTDAQTHEDGEI